MAQQDAYEYDFMIFIGRFQPVHAAHVKTLDRALAMARHVVVLVGSANEARTIRNPFSFEERADLVHGAVTADDRARVHVTPVRDVAGDDAAWMQNVYAAARGIICQYETRGPRIGLIGQRKDATSYYLNLFPDWEFVEAPLEIGINATDVREAYFDTPAMRRGVRANLPAATLCFLQQFARQSAYHKLNRDYQFSRVTTR